MCLHKGHLYVRKSRGRDSRQWFRQANDRTNRKPGISSGRSQALELFYVLGKLKWTARSEKQVGAGKWGHSHGVFLTNASLKTEQKVKGAKAVHNCISMNVEMQEVSVIPLWTIWKLWIWPRDWSNLDFMGANQWSGLTCAKVQALPSRNGQMEGVRKKAACCFCPVRVPIDFQNSPSGNPKFISPSSDCCCVVFCFSYFYPQKCSIVHTITAECELLANVFFSWQQVERSVGKRA